MSFRTRILCLVLGAAAGAIPAAAQTPLFGDGPAFGGSRSFSEGLNPLANPARPEWALPGIFLGYVDGDQRFANNLDALNRLASVDPAQRAEGLRLAAEAPWAQRTRGYGLSFQERSSNGLNTLALIRQEVSTAWISAEGAGARADLRRGIVDRALYGWSATDNQGSVGVNTRLERYRLGQDALSTQGTLGTRPLVATEDPLDYRQTDRMTTTLAFDAGLTLNLSQGIRVAGSVDRLYPRRLWDVYEQIQGRLGLQFDLGSFGQLRVETDTNRTMRFPLALRQKASGASIRIAANPSITLLAGVERREWETPQADGSLRNLNLVKAGATVFFHAEGWHVGFGMQFGNERPLKGGSLRLGQ